jgi:hypothetical protein
MNRVDAQDASAIATCVSVGEAAVSLKSAVIFRPVQLSSGHPVNLKLQHQVSTSLHLENKFYLNVNCIHKARTLHPNIRRLNCQTGISSNFV